MTKNLDRMQTIEKTLVAKDLSFPTSICFDSQGVVFIATSGLPWDGARKGGEIYRIEKNGKKTVLQDELAYPVNGLCFHKDKFYISDGGYPGKIYEMDHEGNKSIVLDNLPGLGNYHTNMVAIGPDDRIYFSQGTLTNSGVIGMDAYELGWLGRLPHNCDIPGVRVKLSGQNFETVNPLVNDGESKAKTGPFSAFNESVNKDSVIEPGLPCTGAIMSCDLEGQDLQLEAWGVRNGYGIAFSPEGELFVTDQGADDRGSRPIGNAADLLLKIKKKAWYGWPDFISAVPVTDKKHIPLRGPRPKFIISNHDELPKPEKAIMEFPVNAAAVKFDFIPMSVNEFAGNIIVALFGDEKPMTAPPGKKIGRNIAMIDTNSWTLHALADLGLERPIDVKYNKHDNCLYILDFGYFEMTGVGVDAKSQSGALWKIELSALSN